MLHFSDGMKIDTGGELRIVEKSDGLYVTGNGKCIPIQSKKEGRELIKTLNK